MFLHPADALYYINARSRAVKFDVYSCLDLSLNKMEPLWSIDSIRFPTPRGSDVSIIPYRNWKDFIDCKPYRSFKPYIMISWSWKEDTFQFIFMRSQTPSLLYVEFPVKKEEEPEIRGWIKKHLHPIWKI